MGAGSRRKTDQRTPSNTAASRPRNTLRWRRRKDARPQEILDAALALFAEKGFAATRLEEIAARAGVSKGTIYLYFESKEAVFKALLSEKVGARIGGFKQILHDYRGSSAELLTDLIRNFGLMISTSDFVVLPKIVIAEAGNFPELARMYREEIVARGLALLGEVIERGIKKGEFKKLDKAHAARLVIAPLMIIAIWRTTFAKFDETPYDYMGLVEAHIATLLNGLAKEAPR